MHVKSCCLLIKPIGFLDVLVAVASLNLYVPNNQSMRERCWLMQRGQLFSHINSRYSRLCWEGAGGDLSTLDRFSPYNRALETQRLIPDTQRFISN